MYDNKDAKDKGFSKLTEDAIGFIKHTANEAKFHLDLSEEGELEEIFCSFEKRLAEKSKFNNELTQLLYRVQKSRKLLKKLHGIWKFESEEPREDVLRAIRGEANYGELEAILEKRNQLHCSYNYQEIRNVLLRKRKNEISDKYFKAWLILLCNSLNNNKYGFISNYFDEYSFCDTYNDKILLEMMAVLKDFNYKLSHNNFISYHKREKIQVIYLRHLFFNTSSNSKIFKAYFVDYKKKRFDVRIIDDALFDYKDELMYCDILNQHLDEDGDYIDEDGEYGFEPAELPEEKRLLEMFYGDEWTCDHELNFGD